MRRTLFLAWRYITFNRVKTAILIACLTITFFLPAALSMMIDYYNRELMARAEATPLVVGARGNRYDLILKSLYFRAETPDNIPYSETDKIWDSDLGTPIPLHIRHSARKFPIIGTDLEYFDFRHLKITSGNLPTTLGDAVIGSKVALKLGLKPGDHIISDQENLYDISTSYPLKMRITGVLAPSGTPDDSAVFVDVRTTWVIDGFCHGHQDLVKTTDKTLVAKRTKENVTGTAKVLEYQEITPKNIESFHFHGTPDTFPLTSMIVVPKDAKSSTILKGRYNVSKEMSMLVPVRVIEELMGIVFKIKKFFDANFAMIFISTLMFITLIVMLSLRIRKREMDTMFRIGCSRLTVFKLQAAELFIIFATSLLLAWGLSYGLILLAPLYVRI